MRKPNKEWETIFASVESSADELPVFAKSLEDGEHMQLAYVSMDSVKIVTMSVLDCVMEAVDKVPVTQDKVDACANAGCDLYFPVLYEDEMHCVGIDYADNVIIDGEESEELSSDVEVEEIDDVSTIDAELSTAWGLA